MHVWEVAVLGWQSIYNRIRGLQGLFRGEPLRQSTPDWQLLQV